MLSSRASLEYAAALASSGKKKKRSKYGNVRMILGGLKFDSKEEMEDYIHFKRLERAGEIRDYRRQVTYQLFAHSAAGPVELCKYKADHVFFDVKQNRERVCDSKGVKTKEFRLKEKLMLANHNIEVECI